MPKKGWQRDDFFRYFLYLLFGISLALFVIDICLKLQPLPPNPCNEELIEAVLNDFEAASANSEPPHILPCAKAGSLSNKTVSTMWSRVRSVVRRCKNNTEYAEESSREHLVMAVLEYQSALARHVHPPIQHVEKKIVKLFEEMDEVCVDPWVVDERPAFPTLASIEWSYDTAAKGGMRSMDHIFRISLLFLFLHSDYRPQVLPMIYKFSSKADVYVREYVTLLNAEAPMRLLDKLADAEDEVQFELVKWTAIGIMLAMNRMAHCNPFPGDNWPSYLNRAFFTSGHEFKEAVDCSFNTRANWAATLDWTHSFLLWQRKHAPLFHSSVYILLLSPVILSGVNSLLLEPVLVSFAALWGKACLILGAYTALFLAHAIYLFSPLVLLFITVVGVLLAYLCFSSQRQLVGEHELEEARDSDSDEAPAAPKVVKVKKRKHY